MQSSYDFAIFDKQPYNSKGPRQFSVVRALGIWGILAFHIINGETYL